MVCAFKFETGVKPAPLTHLGLLGGGVHGPRAAKEKGHGFIPGVGRRMIPGVGRRRIIPVGRIIFLWGG